MLFSIGSMTASSYSIIGGSDGPTSIFLAGKAGGGAGLISFFGLSMVVLMLIPNLVYGMHHKETEARCKSRIANILEQIGRYGCMFLMIFHIGILQTDVWYTQLLFLYLFGDILLMIIYWTLWMFYLNRKSAVTAMLLAVTPTLLFLLSGLALRHFLLAGFAVLFGIFHCYITWVNCAKKFHEAS